MDVFELRKKLVRDYAAYTTSFVQISLVRAAQGLRFLVLDELHTYRGRQGADVALLVRRVRDALDAEHMQCVGTSAIVAGGGTFAEQHKQVAAVATSLFGSPVQPECVIGETLRRATPEPEETATWNRLLAPRPCSSPTPAYARPAVPAAANPWWSTSCPWMCSGSMSFCRFNGRESAAILIDHKCGRGATQ
ncbi:hypothetical protein ABC977_06255 [Thioalkalicoccus limnaeus]|uniref:Helicase ATP-binding domain-containing protein n=1 Tax=Thioalkalicoccus limnaeus TaxID=120681 RepID=A0ABV4BF84_9GAMM